MNQLKNLSKFLKKLLVAWKILKEMYYIPHILEEVR